MADAGTLVVLQHQPGDARRPWTWRMIADHLPMIRAAGYTAILISPHDVGYLSSYAATGMAVTDYALYFALRDSFRFGGNLAALDGAGLAAANGPGALTFVENHDAGPPVNRLLAYAFIAAYPGYPAFFDVDLRDPALSNLAWIQNTVAAGPYVEDAHTDQAGRVEIWIPPTRYVMMAPLR